MRVLVACAAVWMASSQGALAATNAPGTLDSAQIREAIAWGSRASDSELQQYVLVTRPTWTVSFDTAYLRVAQLSSAWRKIGKTVVEKNVPAGLLAGDVNVYAQALVQPGVHESAKSVAHVTLRTRGGRDSIQPSFVRTNLNRTRNRRDFGPARIARSVHAVFSTRDFAAGSELRVEFDDGTQETVPVTAEILAKAR